MSKATWKCFPINSYLMGRQWQVKANVNDRIRFALNRRALAQRNTKHQKKIRQYIALLLFFGVKLLIRSHYRHKNVLLDMTERPGEEDQPHFSLESWYCCSA